MTTTASPPAALRDRSRQSVFSVVLTWVFALLPANFAPTIIEGLTYGHGVSVEAAGIVATAMTLANAAAVLLVKPLVERGHRLLLARIGITLLTGASIVGALVPEVGVIIPALIVGGVGSGVTVATATAASAATRNPDATAQISIICNRVIVAAGFLLLPLLGGSIVAVFTFMAAIGVAAFFGAHWIPRPPTAVADEAAAPARGVDEPGVRGIAWLLALGFALFTITDEGVYGLMLIFLGENLPEVGEGTVSVIIAGSVLAGLVGALIAPLLLKFVGRTTGIAAVLLLSLLAKVGLVFVTAQGVYVASSIAWGFAFGAVIPLVFGFAAQLSIRGSAAVLVNGVYIVGVALGPLVATQIFGAGGKTPFGIVFTILGALAAAVVLVAIRRGERLLARRTIAPQEVPA